MRLEGRNRERKRGSVCDELSQQGNSARFLVLQNIPDDSLVPIPPSEHRTRLLHKEYK